MDLLAGYSSSDNHGSASESELSPPKAKEVAPPAAPGSDNDSDESDGEEAAKSASARKAAASKANAKKGNLLPSVDDLFASTGGPAFLAAPKKDDFVVAPLTKKRKTEAPEAPISAAPKPPRAAPATQQAVAEKKVDGQEKPKERISRKDKVKNQRLNGQVSQLQS